MEDAKSVSTARARTVGRNVSRRTLMKAGAGVGIAAAVGTAGVAFAGPTQQTPTGAKPTGSAGSSSDGTLVVHILDPSKGTAEIFTSSTRRQIKDHDLIARIVRAART